MPKAREIIEQASYNPTTVRIMGKAFDDAWTEIAGNYKSKIAIEGARLTLANVVLNFAAEGERDPQKLKDRAVRTMQVDLDEK
jgi:hypothetical protein